MLSSANTYSYAKRTSTLYDYVTGLQPQRLEVSGADSWYWFGDHNMTTWSNFLSQYEHFHRPLFASRARGDAVSLSFGVAAAGTGVPFHVHGAAFSETLFGRKRWLLSPPKAAPRFDPDEPTLRWSRANTAPLDCTVAAGEAIYVRLRGERPSL